MSKSSPIDQLENRTLADKLFRFVVEAAPNAMILVDHDRLITMVNKSAEELFGYAREDLIGKPIECLVPNRFQQGHSEHVREFLSAPQTRAMGAGRELYGRRRDGTEVPIEIGLNPIETPDGFFTLASIIDITERKHADERFRLAVEAAPNAMLMVGADRRITLVNRKAEDLFGYSREDFIGRPIEDIVPERFRQKHPEFVQGFLAKPKTRAMGAGRELFGRRKDGTEMPIEIGLNPIETAEGLVTLASIIDISERKRAEAAHEQLAAIVEFSDDAIIGKTIDGVITSWNFGAERLFGYTADAAIGRNIAMIIPERCMEAELSLREQIRESHSVSHFETVRKRKDGTEIEVSVTLSPIRSTLGEIIGASSIARDITEIKRRDAELKRSNAELEQFAYVASHDLQEPLRMVANYTELLAQRYQGKLDEKADKYIHYASDGARRMQRLVADLLAYSRVGSQGRPLVKVRSSDVLQGVLESIDRSIHESGASIEFGPLPDVLADEVQLRQLFQNLIGNAIKFRSDAPPRVVVKAIPNGDRWLFSVTDNGIGMEMQYADRIFQMFQRLNERGKYDGSGIGLAISKRIVERHAGSIWIESTPGAGTSFYFTLKPAEGGGI